MILCTLMQKIWKNWESLESLVRVIMRRSVTFVSMMYQCFQSILFQILLNVSNNMNAQIVMPQNLSYELQPILTEVGLCYTFNSRVAHLFNPSVTIPSAKRVDAGRHKKIDLYKINFYDAETEGTLTYTYTGSNFDVSLLCADPFKRRK